VTRSFQNQRSIYFLPHIGSWCHWRSLRANCFHMSLDCGDSLKRLTLRLPSSPYLQNGSPLILGTERGLIRCASLIPSLTPMTNSSSTQQQLSWHLHPVLFPALRGHSPLHRPLWVSAQSWVLSSDFRDEQAEAHVSLGWLWAELIPFQTPSLHSLPAPGSYRVGGDFWFCR
jgi:hypothetical protein